MKLLGIYHNADLDGKCSGAIIKKFYEENDNFDKLTLHGMNYGDEAPRELIEEADWIVMSDFSLKKGDMIWVNALPDKRFLWFDHHISAIDEMMDVGILGQRDTGLAGCELTWFGLFYDKPMPPVVELLGCYDCWRWTKELEPKQERVLNLQYGMRVDALWPEDDKWRHLLMGSGDLEVEMLYIEGGKAIRKYQAQHMARINSSGMVVTWEGYSWFAVNTHNSSSVDYEVKMAELNETVRIQGVIAYRRNKDGSWNHSLRSFSDDLDVSVVAKKHGGGGHKGAAGFNSAKLIKALT